eukprot:6567228-Pyramimonas_sp.AAC.1
MIFLHFTGPPVPITARMHSTLPAGHPGAVAVGGDHRRRQEADGRLPRARDQMWPAQRGRGAQHP